MHERVCVVCLRERWVGAVGLFSKYVFVQSVCAQISENGRQSVSTTLTAVEN